MIRHHPFSSTRGRGFTLVEMVTSLSILSILLLACGSIVAMAGRATGDGSTRYIAQQQTADAASQVTDDLNVALNFTQRTSTAATFTVPDRLGTGSPQTVAYSWDGVTGDPLLRQFNGGTATPVLQSLQNFALAYNSRVMGSAAGTEQVLFSHDSVSLLGSFKDNKLDNKNWGSQYFSPVLSTSGSTYTLTRIRLVLKAGSNPGDALSIKLVQPDSLFRPTGTVIAQTYVYESSLSSSYEWVDVPFTGLSNQNPLQPLCVVLTSAGTSTDCGAVQIDSGIVNILAGAYWSTSSNTGSSWSNGSGSTISRCYVMGTVP